MLGLRYLGPHLISRLRRQLPLEGKPFCWRRVLEVTNPFVYNIFTDDSDKSGFVEMLNEAKTGNAKMIEWVFFDIGSTLIDETEADLHRIRDMIAGTDVTEKAYYEKRFEMIRKGIGGDQGAIEFFGLTKTPWHSEDEKPYEDAVPALAELKRRGFKLGIIANQPLGTEERLTNWGLLGFFDVIAASAELGISKPDPAIFQWTLEQANCIAQNAIMVGDRLDNDIAPANRMGIHSVRLLRGIGAYHEPQSRDELPEYTIRMLAEIFDLV